MLAVTVTHPPRLDERLEVKCQLADRHHVLCAAPLIVDWRVAPKAEHDAQPVNHAVVLAVATLLAERARANALVANRRGAFDEARRILADAVEALSALAPGDAEVEAVVERLRQDQAEFVEVMSPVEMKRRHYASVLGAGLARGGGTGQETSEGVMTVFYSPQYVGTGFAFETTRKAQWIADSLERAPIPGVTLDAPAPLTFDAVAEVHAPAYVRAVQTGTPLDLAQSQGFGWDAGMWPTVLASNGGVVAAALEALASGVSGSLSSGLHHAKRAHGSAFCTFNGLVIAAQAALAAGVDKVLILDFDAHCGGGTASLVADEPRIRQLDVSTSAFDRYTSTDQSRLRLVSDPAHYLDDIERTLDDARRVHGAGLCLYNAGMDPDVSADVLAARERRVFAWCRDQHLPVAFVLAGGYLGHGPRRGRARQLAPADAVGRGGAWGGVAVCVRGRGEHRMPGCRATRRSSATGRCSSTSTRTGRASRCTSSQTGSTSPRAPCGATWQRSRKWAFRSWTRSATAPRSGRC